MYGHFLNDREKQNNAIIDVVLVNKIQLVMIIDKAETMIDEKKTIIKCYKPT